MPLGVHAPGDGDGDCNDDDDDGDADVDGWDGAGCPYWCGC